MTISLRCGDTLTRGFQTRRQASLHVPGVHLTLTDEQKVQLALDALYLTSLGAEELEAAEKELLALAEREGIECGPCPNGANRCEIKFSIDGRTTAGNIDVISVMFEIVQPGNVQGMRITFNYTLKGAVKIACDPCNCDR